MLSPSVKFFPWELCPSNPVWTSWLTVSSYKFRPGIRHRTYDVVNSFIFLVFDLEDADEPINQIFVVRQVHGPVLNGFGKILQS